MRYLLSVAVGSAKLWRSRGFGHLSKDQRGLRVFRITWLDYPRLGHFQPKIVPFARAFPHTRENGNAPMLLRDIVDQFRNDHGLANAGTTE
jgi:hypothetical protein